MLAIKVGNQRVILDNVNYIEERESETLYKTTKGETTENYYAKPEERFTGLIVTVYFVSPSEAPDYVRFYTDEAKAFLETFDAMLQTISVKVQS